MKQLVANNSRYCDLRWISEEEGGIFAGYK